MSIPNFVIKVGMEQAGNFIGGEVGAAVAGIGATTAFSMAEVSNLFDRVESENVRVADVAAAAAAIESFLYTAGMLGAAAGSATIAAPGALVAGLIIAVGFAASYHKNPAAWLDAGEAFFEDTSNPWKATAAAAKAYSKEVARQKQVDHDAKQKFDDAGRLVVRRDPLVLDLDGDGLELLGASGQILFDHNADGIKVGTGWVAPDDGFLVRDVDGNGFIDSGRELFGVDTIKSDGGLATNGFDALRDLDSNGDGFITSADASYGELKIWQDANQDGISQGTELKTLIELNITSIDVSGNTAGPQAGQVINNNSVVQSATFTQNGQTYTVGAIDLEVNNFFTEYPPEVVDEDGNPVPISDQAKTLPQMNGSGMVRNMQAAASLNSDFANALQTFAATSTRDGQRSQLDQLISLWAHTSTFPLGILNGPSSSITYNLPAGITQAQYKNLINVLEAFNGTQFYGDQTGGPRPTGYSISSVTDPATGSLVYHYTVSPPAQQVALLQQAYDALKESVYSALVVQTRLKPYLDSIELTIDETGIHFDTSATVGLAQSKAALDPLNALIDLMEIHKYAAASVSAVGWEPYQTLEVILESTAMTAGIQDFLATEHIEFAGATGTAYTAVNSVGAIVLGNALNNALTGSSGADVLYGFDGNDILQAVGAGDTLNGGDGDDILTSGATAGNQYGTGYGIDFTGGKGNDTIYGSTWGDVYHFNTGDGQDTITDYSWGYTLDDVLIFGQGIAPSDVTPLRSGLDLVFQFSGSTDQVTVKNWFMHGWQQIEQIRFADGTVWSNTQVNLRALEVFGTAGADVLSGVAAFSDVLHGGDGNDTLQAIGSGDTLDGGAGDDVLTAGLVYPDIYVNTSINFTGGTGADTLIGSGGGDTYNFDLGDGQDVIIENGGSDVLKFGPGILPTDVTYERVGLDLVLKVLGGTDQITVKNWFAEGQGLNQLEKIQFADNTIWTNGQINQQLLEVFGTSGNDTMSGVLAFSDVLHGGDGNDTLYATGGGDFLDGGAGDDVLTAGLSPQELTANGRIHFTGGTGNDTLRGSYTADTYHFNVGDGQDTIIEASAEMKYTDVIQFGPGILPMDVVPVRSGVDLVFRLAGGTDQITVKDWFSGSRADSQIEQIKFSDGTIWTNSEVNTRALEVFGTQGSDTLSGVGDYSDILHGGAGDDTLHAVASGTYGENDVMDGGAGNDMLIGSVRADIYVFNLGDGQDTIVDYNWTFPNADIISFGAGILPAGVTPSRSGLDMVLTLAGGSDQITIKDWFADSHGYHQIEKIKFADGTIWTNSEVSMRALEFFGTAGDDVLTGITGFADVLHGGAGNDTLHGNEWGDVLDGGAGDDVLIAEPAVIDSYDGRYFVFSGGTGNDLMIGSSFTDRYLFNLGDGQDVIIDDGFAGYSSVDILNFGPGIAPADVAAVRIGMDLVFRLAGGTDQITVKNWFADRDGYYRIEQVQFADGTLWNKNQVSAMALEVFGGAGDDVMSGLSGFVDVLHGGDGNDTLYADSVGDVLDGGAGDDIFRVDAVTHYSDTDYHIHFTGGTGNDTFISTDSFDIYHFNLGDGQDVITDYGLGYSEDHIKFGAGIDPENVTLERLGDDLVIKIVGTTDQITVKNWFVYGEGSYQIEQIEFANGMWWTNTQINANPAFALDSSSNEELHGGIDDDHFTGGAGNDTLYGDAGNDILIGDDDEPNLAGQYHGDDYLDGGDGMDLLSGGGGNDILHGGDNVDILWGDQLDIAAEYQGDDMLYGEGGDDKLFGHGGNDYLDGGENDDYLNGGEGDDILVGGSGRNILFGGAGNDTFVSTGQDYMDGGAGDDSYTITIGGSASTLDDGQGTNTVSIQGGPSNAGDYRLVTIGGSTFLVVAGMGMVAIGEQVDMSQTFLQVGNQTVSLLALAQRDDPSGKIHAVGVDASGALVNTATSTTSWSLMGGGQADILEGGLASDDLLGGAGDDALYGGAGNDILQGGYGSDLIVGGTGDDQLMGDSGRYGLDNASDTFLFNLGDGNDLISAAYAYPDNTPHDVVRFGAGISAGSIQLTLLHGAYDSGDCLMISYGGNDAVTLTAEAFGKLNEIQFADGSVMTRAQIFANLGAQALAAGETVKGPDSGAALAGDAGNNHLLGGIGDDVLVGGAGNDILDGGLGRNTYVFGADSGLDVIRLNQSAGVLRFTDALMSQMAMTLDGDDLLIWQPSGASLRIVDYSHSSADSPWQIIDSTGAQMGVDAWLGAQAPAAALTLAQRREQFLALQLNQLGTLSQRPLGMDYYYWVDGPSALASKMNTVNQAAVQVAGGAALQLGSYLNVGNSQSSGTSYLFGQVYGPATVTTPGQPGYFLPVKPDGTQNLPNGAVAVYGYGSSETPGNHGAIDYDALYSVHIIGWNVPATQTQISATYKVTGWQSFEDTYYQTGASDTVTQTMVTGTAGDDLIVQAPSDSAYPSLFRGLIDTGAGNDVVLLGNGSNSNNPQAWSRFQDWQGIRPSVAYGDYFQHGLGAWIDLGAGNDTAAGTDGNDFIIGGAGSDWMDGQAGADTYYIGYEAGSVDHISDLARTMGYGWDYGYDYGWWDLAALSPANKDVVEFDGSVSLAGLTYSWTTTALNDPNAPASSADTLQLYKDGQLFLEIDYFDPFLGDEFSKAGVEQFRFSNGQTLALADLLAAINPYVPPLPSTSGDDLLMGSSGNDVLNGGLGNDMLQGGQGNDTYVLNRGYGTDTILDIDATGGNADVAQFGANISTDQLWFKQAGNNLEVSVIGTNDALVVENWYLGSQYHVEQFRTSDGTTLLDSQVQNLVQAMAGFSPPAAGQTTLPAGYANALNTVIAANWH